MSYPAEPLPIDRELGSFFEDLLAGFDATAARLGHTQRELTIARRPVRVHFAGDRLSGLIRPLAHLIRDREAPNTAGPALEILAWESAACGILPPAPPRIFRQLTHRGEICGLASEEFAVNLTSDQHLLSLLHKPSGRAIYWIPDANHLPFWESAAPFRVLLSWWAASFGGQMAHAAAVGSGAGGTLLVGRGGSGKSTTSLLCVDAGMQIAGDDYVLLTHDPQPAAHSLYHSAKMHTAFLQTALPHWRGRIAGEIGPERKSLFYLHEFRPEQVCRELPIGSVLAPRVTAAPQARRLPTTAAKALLAVAPSTMYQLPDARQESLAFFARFLSELPAFTLHLGTDVRSGPREIDRLLDQQEVLCAA